MANIKSAKKRILTAERNYERNVAFKSAIKTAVKKTVVLAQAKEKDQAAINSALSEAYKLCDKAASKGILHKNTAARKKSRLVLAVKRIQADK
jgi:small subunit ribosomal protein S20